MPDRKPLNFAQALRVKPAAPREEPAEEAKSTPVVTPPPTPVEAPVSTPAVTPVEPRPQSLDSTHTTSEGMIYSNMYRLTVSKGIRERHFGPKELAQLTGIRSDRTIRTALDGLIAKKSIEIVWEQNGYPLGPRYRVYEPREVTRRRREAGIEIDPQTKRITTPVATPVTAGATGEGKNYPRTPVEATPVTPVDFAGDTINKISPNPIGKEQSDDDEGFAPLYAAAKDITGKGTDPRQWKEVAELLAAELRLAAGRTTVSSVPAFLAEHLRRRLWKKDKRQIDEEGQMDTPKSAARVDASNCPDCFGTGMRYRLPNFEGGVVRCAHDALREGKGD